MSNHKQSASDEYSPVDKIHFLYSIKGRFIGTILCLLFIISAFIFFFFPYRQKQQSLRDYRSKAISIAEMTAYSVSPGLIFQDEEAMKEGWAGGAMQNKELCYIAVFDNTGKVIIDTQKDTSVDTEYKSVKESETQIKDGILHVQTPIFSEERAQIGTLTLGLSLEDVQVEITASRAVAVVVSLGILIAGGFISWIITTQISRPVTRVVESMQNLADGQGDPTQRLKLTSRSEIGALVQAFNAFVAKLHAIIIKEKQTEAELLAQRERIREAKIAAEVANKAKSEFLDGAKEVLESLESEIGRFEKFFAGYDWGENTD